MKKLYVTDLDGTLLNSQIKLSTYTIDTLNRLIQSNLMITYSTARSFYTTSKLLNQVNFQLPCITYNGVYVIDAKTGEVIRKNLLEHSIFNEVMDIAKKLKLKPFVFGKTALGEEKLLYENEENTAHIRFIEERRNRNDKRLKKISLNEYQLDEFITISFLYPLEEIRSLEQILKKKYEEEISIKTIKDIYNEGYYTLEVSNKDANKGKMLEYISEYLGIDLDNITVFGDQENDKEMFEKAGTKVAVNNANRELKSLADIIIESNDDDGVAKYLEKEYLSYSVKQRVYKNCTRYQTCYFYYGKAESKARRYYMLGGKGFLQCGICEKSMTGTVRKSHGKTYITYQCPSHKAKQCETKEVRADRLNLIVAQQLAKFFFREDRLKDWEDLLRSDIRDDPENKGLKNRIRGIDKKMENILQNLEYVVSKALTQRLDELTRKKEELESKLKNDKCTDKDNER